MRCPAVCSAPLLTALVLTSFAVPSALPIGTPHAAAATFNDPPAPQGIGFSQVVAGAGHTCGLADNGMVYCWGRNDSGQLGDGATEDRLTPVAVSSLTGVVAIAAGRAHICAILTNGSARCWGNNDNGQLGNGTTTDRLTPVVVSGLSNAVAITTGKAHTCALLRNGTARCWGSNYWGQLGNETNIVNEQPTPVVVNNLNNAVALTAGGTHTCALLADGTARCWGWDFEGQLGNGATGGLTTNPVAVRDLSGAVTIAAGASHTCALLAIRGFISNLLSGGTATEKRCRNEGYCRKACDATFAAITTGTYTCAPPYISRWACITPGSR